MNFAPLVPHELEVQVSPIRKEAGVPVALGTEYVGEVKEGRERERERERGGKGRESWRKGEGGRVGGYGPSWEVGVAFTILYVVRAGPWHLVIISCHSYKFIISPLD